MAAALSQLGADKLRLTESGAPSSVRAANAPLSSCLRIRKTTGAINSEVMAPRLRSTVPIKISRSRTPTFLMRRCLRCRSWAEGACSECVSSETGRGRLRAHILLYFQFAFFLSPFPFFSFLFSVPFFFVRVRKAPRQYCSRK